MHHQEEQAGQEQDQGNNPPQEWAEGKGQPLVGGVGTLQIGHQHDVAHEVVGGLGIGNLAAGTGLEMETAQGEVRMVAKDLKEPEIS